MLEPAGGLRPETPPNSQENSCQWPVRQTPSRTAPATQFIDWFFIATSLTDPRNLRHAHHVLLLLLLWKSGPARIALRRTAALFVMLPHWCLTSETAIKTRAKLKQTHVASPSSQRFCQPRVSLKPEQFVFCLYVSASGCALRLAVATPTYARLLIRARRPFILRIDYFYPYRPSL